MSILPAFKIVLDSNLDDAACNEINDKIKNTKGVMGAHFNAKARAINVTYNGDMRIRSKVAKMPGVKKIENLF